MKKKILYLFSLSAAIVFLMFFFSTTLGLVALCVFLLFCFGFATLFIFNSLYKQTNHYKNYYGFAKKFVSGFDYRTNLSRNYDVVNLGSNPALFGFFYEKDRGQNWSTGSQGLEMDYAILKRYHSYLKKNGCVLIPIMPFTAVSQYIKTKKQYWGDNYYGKFASILDESQINDLPNGSRLKKMVKYPLFIKPKLIRYVFVDDPVDDRLQLSNQTMNRIELENDAERMINLWLKEFDAKSLNDFMGTKYFEYIKEGQAILDSIIQFCKTRNYTPVLLTIPMSSYLRSKFSHKFHSYMINDFINGLSHKGVVFLDYFEDPRFLDTDLFLGSFYLNLRGRKYFTEQVMNDLKKHP